MSEDEIKGAIAVHMGWQWWHSLPPYGERNWLVKDAEIFIDRYPEWKRGRMDGLKNDYGLVPDYANSLDAMAQVEAVIADRGKSGLYYVAIKNIIEAEAEASGESWNGFDLIIASARTRALAALAVLDGAK
jgi:hypothetical protein